MDDSPLSPTTSNNPDDVDDVDIKTKLPSSLESQSQNQKKTASLEGKLGNSKKDDCAKPSTEYDVTKSSEEKAECADSSEKDDSDIKSRMEEKSHKRLSNKSPSLSTTALSSHSDDDDNDDDKNISDENNQEADIPKRKKRQRKTSVDMKLKNLKWTLNQPCNVSGKRLKKAPDRFELSIISKRKNSMDDAEGDGDPLGSIPWIVQHVKEANVYTLRLLHRVIFRKQGMFSEKHIRRSLMSFRGFPFDFSSIEVEKRKLPLEKSSMTSLIKLCELLGVKSGEKAEMINNVLKFLHCPSKQQVEDYIKETASARILQKDTKDIFPTRFQFANLHFPQNHPINFEDSSDSSQDESPKNKFNVSFPGHNFQIGSTLVPSISNANELKMLSKPNYENNVLTVPWKKPEFFEEGTGTKLKCFKPIVVNMQIATHNFIEKLHKLLYLRVDHSGNMRRNILEFSGFSSAVGTSGYMERNKFLYELPMDQIKFICRVLCLPTWHRSRQFLIDGILNFLAAPCLSPMKKTVPPPSTNKDHCYIVAGDLTKKMMSPEDAEEIEIIPDIHVSENEFCTQEMQMKLKNFPNIHYQVISTPAAKLNDLHMVLYGRPCPLNNIRKNILEFSCFPFDEHSPEYQSRKSLLENMSLDSLITVVTVLNLTQFVVDLSRQNIVQAVLKFLSKPLSCGNESAILPMELPAEESKNKVEQSRLNLQMLEKSGEITIQPIKTEPSPPPPPPPRVQPKARDGANKRKSQPPMKFIMSPSTTISEKDDEDDVPMVSNISLDVPLAKIKKSDHGFDSDENDDKPLSKFIGHPNDDQLRILIAKILKDSKLEEITMKQVIRKVYNAYPNFELTYRKEFIKSVVRQILSQMEDPRCSVSTTVYAF